MTNQQTRNDVDYRRIAQLVMNDDPAKDLVRLGDDAIAMLEAIESGQLSVVPTESLASTQPQATGGSVAVGNDGKKWPQTFDGMAWAVEFNKRFPAVAVDDALGWFCNAIMIGYDTYRWRQEEKEIQPPSAQVDENGALSCAHCGGKCDVNGWLGTDADGDEHRGPECEGCGVTARTLEGWNRRASIATQQAEPQRVPEGWQIVPKLINRDLSSALCQRFDVSHPTNGELQSYWDSLLQAAAPTPPATQPQGDAAFVFDEERERELFEADQMEREHYLARNEDGTYADQMVEDFWFGWKCKCTAPYSKYRQQHIAQQCAKEAQQPSDTEMLDWCQNHLKQVRQLVDGSYWIDYLDPNGMPRDGGGDSLRAACMAAMPPVDRLQQPPGAAVDDDKRDAERYRCPRPINGADDESAAWCVLSGNCGCDHSYKLILRRFESEPNEKPRRCKGCGFYYTRSQWACCPKCGARP